MGTYLGLLQPEPPRAGLAGPVDLRDYAEALPDEDAVGPKLLAPLWLVPLVPVPVLALEIDKEGLNVV